MNSAPGSGCRQAPTRTIVLVDGSNVARCSSWIRRLDEAAAADIALARRRLVDVIMSWAGSESVDVLLVFDGAGPWRAGRTELGPGIAVVGSGGSASGDDLLERAAAEARASQRAHWIVTSDRTLQVVAGAGAQRVLGSDDFIETWVDPRDADGERRSLDASDMLEQPATPSRLDGLLDPAVVEQLDRLRRGE